VSIPTSISARNPIGATRGVAEHTAQLVRLELELRVLELRRKAVALGLASGLGLAAQAEGVRVVGVEAAQSPALRTALDAGRPVPIDPGPTLADGLAGNLEAGTVTFDIIRRTVADVVSVSEAEIEAAMRFLDREHGLIAEGSAVVGIAALRCGRITSEKPGATVVVVTGRNVASEVLERVLGR
ncbi:MAG TPA: pyridoxal-phosphate dependent enzyme, partial [Acidimicrobiia bacterium]